MTRGRPEHVWLRAQARAAASACGWCGDGPQASPRHLYVEELDAVSGQHLGTYPQVFTHLALIDVVRQLIELEVAHSAHG